MKRRQSFWSSRPGRALPIATGAAIVVFTLLGVVGLIVSGVTLFQMSFVLQLYALSTFVID
ncbi:MAG: hypothetical protein ACXQTH_03740 [Dehalococcoidia bacterium]